MIYVYEVQRKDGVMTSGTPIAELASVAKMFCFLGEISSPKLCV